MWATLAVSVSLLGAPAEPAGELHPAFCLTEGEIQAAVEHGKDLAKRSKSWRQYEKRWWRVVRRTRVKLARTVISGRVMWCPPRIFAEHLGYQAQKLRLSEEQVEAGLQSVRRMCAPGDVRAGFMVELFSPQGFQRRTQPVGMILTVDGGGEFPADELVVARSGTKWWTDKRTVNLGGADADQARWTVFRREVAGAESAYYAIFELVEEDGSPRIPLTAQWIELRIVFEGRERKARFKLPDGGARGG